MENAFDNFFIDIQLLMHMNFMCINDCFWYFMVFYFPFVQFLYLCISG